MGSKTTKRFPRLVAREDIEDRERGSLAPYAVLSGETRGRVHSEPDQPLRSAFHLDRDRIVHSTAFRRLEYKTQVFVNHEGDHYRTRLTHSMEVAQISRTIARLLGLNEDLVEVIALAHDVGHAPFGHAGQEALDELMARHGGFNHNLHGLRVVDHLEVRYPDFRGLNLTWEVREAIVKHGRGGGEGVPEEFVPAWAASLEAQVADIADSIAYDNHDIDDGLRSGFVHLAGLESLRLWRQARDAVRARYGAALSEKLEIARTVSQLIHLEVTDLIQATMGALADAAIRSLADVRQAGRLVVRFSPAMEELRSEVKAFLFKNLYRHFRAVTMAEKARRFVTALFSEYLRSPAQLPPDYAALIAEEGKEIVVCDYVAGMTDRFCQEEYNRLFQPFERM